MPTQPEDMLATAVDLAARDSEPFRRAAAHMAYYAVYHLACETFGLDPARRYFVNASHQAVIERVKAAPPGSSRLHRLKRYLRKLKDLRVRADYNLGGDISAREVREALVIAADIFRAEHPP